MYIQFDDFDADKKDFMLSVTLSQTIDIPCFARVSSVFSLDFSAIYNERSSEVIDWKKEDLEARCAAGAGGQYIYSCPALVSLELKNERYEIVDLKFYNKMSGWHQILQNGVLTPPHQYGDADE